MVSNTFPTWCGDEHPSSTYTYLNISSSSPNLPIKLVSSLTVEWHQNQILTDWLIHHKVDVRYIHIIKYLTGNALHSFHWYWCWFISIESYDFPAILLFDDGILTLFQSLIKSHYDSSILDSTIGTSVALMDIRVYFLVLLCITFLATITYIFCFTRFIFPRHFSHQVWAFTSDFYILRLL